MLLGNLTSPGAQRFVYALVDARDVRNRRADASLIDQTSVSTLFGDRLRGTSQAQLFLISRRSNNTYHASIWEIIPENEANEAKLGIGRTRDI